MLSALPLCTKSKYLPCALGLCACSVCWLCPLSSAVALCTCFVYWLCVLALCKCSEHWLCTLPLCTVSEHLLCALASVCLMCTFSAHWSCALAVCIHSVHLSCVLCLLLTVCIGFGQCLNAKPHKLSEFMLGKAVLKTIRTSEQSTRALEIITGEACQ